MTSTNVIHVNLDDPRLVPYRALHNRSVEHQSECFVAEGQLIVDRLIDSDCQTESLLVEPGKLDRYAAIVDSTVPIFCLSRERIHEVVGFDFHRGVMACGRRSLLCDVSEMRYSADSVPVALAVLGVSDQENLGSMFRSAAALGIDKILLGPNTIDPFLRRVIRVSMGSVFKHQLFVLDDPVNQLAKLSHDGIRTIASTLAGSTDICEFHHDDRSMVLLVGHEASGIDRDVQDIATDRVQIPMRLGTNSLNVSVAAAILMYELTKKHS